MNWTRWLEPLRAFWAKKRWERLQFESACRLMETAWSQSAAQDSDARQWQLLGGATKEDAALHQESLRDRARWLVDANPHARQILLQYRNYVIGSGMKQDVLWSARESDEESTVAAEARGDTLPKLRLARRLWRSFLDANEWDIGHRKDWEFCWRTWRDGECFLRLFRQPAWPPRVHFIDPEIIAPDPRTGLPTGGIGTEPDQVEAPLFYNLVRDDRSEPVEASLVLHAKIGVDGNVKRGLSILQPVAEALERFQGWLDVELIQRKVASSIVLVRKHQQNYPGGLANFADQAAAPAGSGGDGTRRRLTLQPGTIIDAQGFDLQFLSPNTHFDDGSLLGRMILLSIAAGTGLPEFMLSADASNANYSSTLVAEGPAVRHFAAWQTFFIGQWRKLFRMVMHEAVRLRWLDLEDLPHLDLCLTPPTLAVRQRLEEAQADAIYFDRGVLSRQELARRDHADADLMRRERGQEAASAAGGGAA